MTDYHVNFRSIPSRKIRLRSGQTVDCPICLDVLVEGEVVRRLACRHSFHDICLQESLRQDHRCPFCRTPVFEFPQIFRNRPVHYSVSRYVERNDVWYMFRVSFNRQFLNEDYFDGDYNRQADGDGDAENNDDCDESGASEEQTDDSGDDSAEDLQQQPSIAYYDGLYGEGFQRQFELYSARNHYLGLMYLALCERLRTDPCHPSVVELAKVLADSENPTEPANYCRDYILLVLQYDQFNDAFIEERSTIRTFFRRLRRCFHLFS